MVSEDLEEPCGAEPQPAISMDSRGNSGMQHQLSVHSAIECPHEQGGPSWTCREHRAFLGWLSLGVRDLGKDHPSRQRQEKGGGEMDLPL